VHRISPKFALKSTRTSSLPDDFEWFGGFKITFAQRRRDVESPARKRN
jgi:hypothetical protein